MWLCLFFCANVVLIASEEPSRPIGTPQALTVSEASLAVQQNPSEGPSAEGGIVEESQMTRQNATYFLFDSEDEQGSDVWRFDDESSDSGLTEGALSRQDSSAIYSEWVVLRRTKTTLGDSSFGDDSDDDLSAEELEAKAHARA